MFIEVPKFYETSPTLKNFWLHAWSPTPLLRTQTLATRSTCNKLLFLIFSAIVYIYTWIYLICVTCPIFLKPFDGKFGQFLLRIFKGTILSSIICVLLNGQLYSLNKEHISVAASVNEYRWSRILESSPKLSKIFLVMKHYKKMSVMKHFSIKVFFFSFSLNWLVG